MTDNRFMQRALELAAKAAGLTRPNPMVGAVVVQGDVVVGEGYHAQAGKPHAEVVALRRAGADAKGATLYVTLEPCCHHGRTPPCTERIIESGIARVVYAMRDPNPQVRGRGLKALRDAGLHIDGPICEKDAERLNRPFLHWINTGLPYVIVKVATTLDGKIADQSGASQWITNEETRSYVHSWRARADAILVGRKTAVRDNPQLTVRLPDYRGPQPQPIIWVGADEIPWRARLLSKDAAPALCIVDDAPLQAKVRLQKRGHQLIVGKTVGTVLKQLGRRGISTLLVEGGAQTLSGFLRGGWINYCIVTMAPKLLGGKGLGWTDGVAWSVTNPARLQVEKVQHFGDNVAVEGCLRTTDDGV